MMESGAQCMMIDGVTMMQLLCVSNWDFKEKVYICHHLLYIIDFNVYCIEFL